MDPAAYLASELAQHAMWAGTDLVSKPPVRRVKLALADGREVVGHGETETDAIDSVARELYKIAQAQK